MLDHQYDGCPTNSHCTKEYGVANNAWRKIISQKSSKHAANSIANEQIKTKGLPWNIWATNEIKNAPLSASWDSPCLRHRPSETNPQTYQASVIVKNSNSLVSLPGAIAEIALAKFTHEEALFIIPRGEVPAYMDNRGMVFLMEEGGNYYALKSKLSGEIELTTFLSQAPAPIEAQCPEDLKEHFIKKRDNLKNLYSEYFCKNIWNIDSKTYITTVFGWSCL